MKFRFQVENLALSSVHKPYPGAQIKLKLEFGKYTFRTGYQPIVGGEVRWSERFKKTLHLNTLTYLRIYAKYCSGRIYAETKFSLGNLVQRSPEIRWKMGSAVLTGQIHLNQVDLIILKVPHPEIRFYSHRGYKEGDLVPESVIPRGFLLTVRKTYWDWYKGYLRVGPYYLKICELIGPEMEVGDSFDLLGTSVGILKLPQYHQPKN